jgi:DNA-directed RNA polymerase alpha subunit
VVLLLEHAMSHESVEIVRESRLRVHLVAGDRPNGRLPLTVQSVVAKRRGRRNVTEHRRTTPEEARSVGDAIGVNWERFELEQFRAGMDVEYEHGSHDPQTDVTGDDPIITGKIALAHMKEFPDYYERLERMEEEAKRDWAERQTGS